MSNLIKNLIGIVAIILVVYSCQYKFIVEPAPPPPQPGDTVSFSLELVPIWNGDDNCVACHTTGGQKPDLTPDNAYSSIMGTPGVVNTADPESSLLYLNPLPSNTSNHTWKKYKAGEADLVLLWIKQGAKNN